MLALVIIIFGFLSRIVVHTPNFSPVLSLGLFAGVYLKGRQPMWVPLALMALGDAFLGFHPIFVYTWGSIVLISMMGLWLKNRKNWTNILLTSLLSSILFFIVTNFGDFLILYPHTLMGLQQCYIAAIPFYRSTLISTMAYSLVLFSLWEFIILPRENSISAKESAV